VIPRPRRPALFSLPLVALLGDGCWLFPDPEPEPTPKPIAVEPKPAPPAPTLGRCPSPNVNDVLKDPLVQKAFEEAWRKSFEGDPQEEGFWVVQVREPTPSGLTYRTQIVPNKPGTVDEILMTKPSISRGRVVLMAHTHPGKKEEERYDNAHASPQDIAAQVTTGVPSVIRYGEKPPKDGTPAKTSTIRTPLPDGGLLDTPRDPKWTCPDEPPPDDPPQDPGSGPAPTPVPPPCGDCARSTGDPHLTTHDGLHFDLQAAGEFVAVTVDDAPRLQLRLEPQGSSRQVAITTAVAFKVGDTRLSIRPALGLYVDGQPARLQPSAHSLAGPAHVVMIGDTFTAAAPDPLALPGGGQVQRYGADYVIDWPDHSRLWVLVQAHSLDVFFEAASETQGRTRGLFGVHNDRPADDLTTRDGQLLPAPDFEPLHRQFAESWRVRPDESLFDYQPGETTDTFTDRSMPDAEVSLATLDPTLRASAQDRCTRAGIVDPVAHAECTLDLALSGDPAFIASARAVQTIARRPPPPDATAVPYRITYSITHGDAQPETMIVSSAPPREALLHGTSRILLDHSAGTVCTGDATTMHCGTTDETNALGPFGAFGLHEDPAVVRAWLKDPPSSPLERAVLDTILGRKAVCKRIDLPGVVSSDICHDHATGALLRVRVTNAGKTVMNIEATAFGKPLPADFVRPESTTTTEPPTTP
jgi:hypothetical protein